MSEHFDHLAGSEGRSPAGGCVSNDDWLRRPNHHSTGGLEGSDVVGVAYQTVGDRVTCRVHRTGARHPDGASTDPSCVLNRRRPARFDERQRHRLVCAHVGRHRTGVPGRNNAGEAVVVSQTTRTVRPSRCQPPGDVDG